MIVISNKQCYFNLSTLKFRMTPAHDPILTHSALLAKVNTSTWLIKNSICYLILKKQKQVIRVRQSQNFIDIVQHCEGRNNSVQINIIAIVGNYQDVMG